MNVSGTAKTSSNIWPIEVAYNDMHIHELHVLLLLPEKISYRGKCEAAIRALCIRVSSNIMRVHHLVLVFRVSEWCFVGFNGNKHISSKKFIFSPKKNVDKTSVNVVSCPVLT